MVLAPKCKYLCNFYLQKVFLKYKKRLLRDFFLTGTCDLCNAYNFTRRLERLPGYYNEALSFLWITGFSSILITSVKIGFIKTSSDVTYDFNT